MQSRSKVLLAIGLITGVIVALAGASIVGYDQWSKSDLSGRFISSDNALVVADLVQVGSINPGQIIAMNVDVGDSVTDGQVIAAVYMPALIARSGITEAAKMGFRDVWDQRAEVVAPRSGVIAAVWAKEGDTVAAGQPIVTVMDPMKVWIVADIDEEKIGRVRPGQPVGVELKSLGRTLAGRVDTVSPVTSAMLLPDSSSSRNLRRSPQVIQIKITLDETHPSLIPGSTARVKIQVR